MKASVVVCTYNRAASLEGTLQSLQRQTYRNFEVIVVEGPSTDETSLLLRRWSGRIRTVRCPETNLGKARNLGIDLAAGEVVAFIDDDAVADAGWLAMLTAGYDAEDVGGVGGITFEGPAARPVPKYPLCDRAGKTSLQSHPPPATATQPGANPFLYLQGTNSSFRRSCLMEVRGFDEALESIYDDCEIALKVIDRGYRLKIVEDAVVHHLARESHIRRADGSWSDPFSPTRDLSYFATKHSLPKRSKILPMVVDAFVASRVRASNSMSGAQWAEFLERTARGVSVGIEAGLSPGPDSRDIAPQNEELFQPLVATLPRGEVLTIVLVSGISASSGKVSEASLAILLSQAGHRVVLVRAAEECGFGFERGVWTQDIAVRRRRCGPPGNPDGWESWFEAVALYDAVVAVHARSAVDMVLVQSDPQRLMFSLDARFVTRLVSEVEPADDDALSRLESLRGTLSEPEVPPSDRPVVVEYLDLLLRKAGHLSDDDEIELAACLLKPVLPWGDLEFSLEESFQTPRDRFLSEEFNLLLRRPPGRNEGAFLEVCMRLGFNKEAVAYALLTSPEMRIYIDDDLQRVVGPLTARLRGAQGVTLAVGMTLAQRLVRAMFVLRAAKPIWRVVSQSALHHVPSGADGNAKARPSHRRVTPASGVERAVLGPPGRAKVLDLEVAQGLRGLEDVKTHSAAYLLIRLEGVPLGYVSVPVREGKCSVERLWRAVLEQLPADSVDRIARHLLKGAGREPQGSAENITPPADPTQLSVAVVVCTHNRPGLLKNCLVSLSEIDHPALEIVVVDNAPEGGETNALVSAFPNVKYVVEERVGLARARNLGIMSSDGEIVAFTDDDVVVDPGWVRALERSFAANESIDVVTGLVAPLELETEAQVHMEQAGIFGRGFREIEFSRELQARPHQHIESGKCGTGANMAYRRRVFEDVGLFDAALGAGTVSKGCEELDMFFRVMEAGGRILYQPSAIIRHQHFREWDDLHLQERNYAVAFSSFIVKLAFNHPHLLGAAVRFWFRRVWVAGLRPLIASAVRLEWASWPRKFQNLTAFVYGLTCYPKSRNML